MRTPRPYLVGITNYVIVEALDRDGAREAALRYDEDGGIPDWSEYKTIRPATYLEQLRARWAEATDPAVEMG